MEKLHQVEKTAAVLDPLRSQSKEMGPPLSAVKQPLMSFTEFLLSFLFAIPAHPVPKSQKQTVSPLPDQVRSLLMLTFKPAHLLFQRLLKLCSTYRISVNMEGHLRGHTGLEYQQEAGEGPPASSSPTFPIQADQNDLNWYCKSRRRQ